MIEKNAALRSSLSLSLSLTCLFFRPKQCRTMPSHSIKLIGGGGFRGSIRTILDSTIGGGRKLHFFTRKSKRHRARSCAFTARRQYIELEGEAHTRRANSSWNISTAARKKGRCASSLNVSGDEIW